MKKQHRALGFSLVELMITLALIGVLAAIGLPSYKRMRTKAFQAEAKSHLSAIYTAEKSFFFEYNAYSASLKAIGYAPMGRNRFNAGFGSYAGLHGLSL